MNYHRHRGGEMGYAIGPNFFRREMIFYVFYASANAMIATVSRLNKMLNIIIPNQLNPNLIDSLSSTTCSADSYQEEKRFLLLESNLVTYRLFAAICP